MLQNNQNIGLIVDDICSLPNEIIEKYQMEVVKTKLFFPELEKNSERNLYQIMAETKSCPKTSAPSPGNYLKVYKKVLEKFEKVLVISLSSKLSGCYNSALEAKQFLPDPSRIIIFDSLQAVAPEGLLVIKAAKMIEQKQDIEEIVKNLENIKEEARLFAFLETTYWVEKIGRMTHLQGNIFKILKVIGVQPMIGIRKGRVDLTGFNFWTKDTLQAIFNQLKHLKGKYKKIEIGMNYTNNIDLAYKLKEKLKKDLETDVVFTSLNPPIVGANTGPGTLLVGCLSI